MKSSIAAVKNEENLTSWNPYVKSVFVSLVRLSTVGPSRQPMLVSQAKDCTDHILSSSSLAPYNIRTWEISHPCLLATSARSSLMLVPSRVGNLGFLFDRDSGSDRHLCPAQTRIWVLCREGVILQWSDKGEAGLFPWHLRLSEWVVSFLISWLRRGIECIEWLSPSKVLAISLTLKWSADRSY